MDIRRTVVLVDASEEYRTMLQEAIDQSEIFSVIGSAGSGSEALELVESRRPDAFEVQVFKDNTDGPLPHYRLEGV